MAERQRLTKEMARLDETLAFLAESWLDPTSSSERRPKSSSGSVRGWREHARYGKSSKRAAAGSMMADRDPRFPDHSVLRLGAVDSTQEWPLPWPRRARPTAPWWWPTPSAPAVVGGAGHGWTSPAPAFCSRSWCDRGSSPAQLAAAVPRRRRWRWPALSSRAAGVAGAAEVAERHPGGRAQGGRHPAGVAPHRQARRWSSASGSIVAQERFPADLQARRPRSAWPPAARWSPRPAGEPSSTSSTRGGAAGGRGISRRSASAWKALSSTLGAWVRVDEVSGRRRGPR